MKWKILIKDYFTRNNEGTVNQIKLWIENKYLYLLIEEVTEYYKRYNPNMLNTINVTNLARRRLWKSGCVYVTLNILFKKKLLFRKQNISGTCKWNYIKNS